MKLHRTLTRLTVGVLLTVCLTVPALALEGVVNTSGSVLRVRKTASTSSAILDLLPDGKRLEITDTGKDGWYGVRLSSGTTGYVSASYIRLVDAAAAAAETAPAETTKAEAVKTEPAAEKEPSVYVRVTADALNVRSAPNTEAEIVGELASGKVTRVLAEADGWYQVYGGYIDAEYTESATLDDAIADGLYVRVTTSRLNIRSGAGTGYAKVGSLASGRRVKVLGIENGWYQIEQGYISGDYVEEVDYSPAAVSGKGQELANIALQYVGYSYVYGGASPSVGFDCSGLMQYACAQLGYSINRTASAQLQNGVSVGWDELSPGDLVFFKKPGNTSSKPVSHVGMYIGDGKFVHASDYGVGVIISKLSDAYYTTGYVGARRIAV